ncbi:unnamed protein product [Vitrella brassicaformis CCMP3155]|uniref:DNA polymerase n=1 Tax=Vitrella brassicaformis (strain CCMP3155) TaxID=1169540 RepID=A0A0G4EBR5_VITBC|nr:unnamed protein product [Vitrella brassicaformis CCMP3155]|eukprot:CEL92970.1 unnamed protein product [Vitrella brassicaformis CCMP3155]
MSKLDGRKARPRAALDDDDVDMDADNDDGEPMSKRMRSSDWDDEFEPLKRKDLDAPLDPNNDRIVFMQIDIDQYTGKAKRDMWPQGGIPAPDQEVPILRMFGVTEGGQSVLAHIHGFMPYFYCQCPDKCRDSAKMRAKLEERLRVNNRGIKQLVLHVEVVQKQSLMWYVPDSTADTSHFFRITVAQPRLVPPCRDIIERGLELQPGARVPTTPYATFESNIAFPLRYMIDNGVTGGCWVEVPAGSYQVRSHATTVGLCQIEVDLPYTDLVSLPTDGDYMKLAPLRVLSFDIECVKLEGQGFPQAEEDPVIQIATVVKIHGDEEPLWKAVFVLGTCAPVAGAHVYTFETEYELLQRWSDFLTIVDPDVLTGYNVINFDLNYLITRAGILKVDKFAHIGRIQTAKSKIRDTVFQSRAYGIRENKEINTEGRVQFDVLHAIQRDHKLRSYSLNAVSAHFLNEQKEDVHYSMIGDLHRGNAETRQRVASYCLKDATLPLRLMDHLLCMYNYVEMARVTGTPLSYLLTRGQQIKVVSQLYRTCLKLGYIFPYAKQESSEEKFEGATVLEPEKDFYGEPIATLDFASLYPSIMMAYNLCYCTLIPPQYVSQMNPDEYTKTPIGHCFVKKDNRQGVLPLVLTELLAARKRAKKDMNAAQDPLTKMVLNGRQLALKISANSVYGFTGATVGQLACLEISSSVTAFGRQMIDQTKEHVERRYKVAAGYPHDAKVIYGDTDSVMVNFGEISVEEAMKYGLEASQEISKTFPPPIRLEFEKVYCPFLLMNKKRYAGLIWTKPEKYDKMDCKGIETVRRDWCELVQKTVDDVLNLILVERSVPQAKECVKRVVADLLQNKVDMSLLVISKSLAKSANAEDYKAKQPHVELAERMRARDPTSAPAVGDRVAFVYIKGHKDARAYEKAEDPLYVLEQNLAIDAQYYLEHQLKQPIIRIFEPLMERPESLFAGNHTLKVSVPMPAGGAMAKFVQRSLTCLGCRAPIKEGALCKNCKKKEIEIYLKKLDTFRDRELEFNKLWSECQRCQGSLHQDVICTSRDCPIFYRRERVKRDIAQAAEAMQRLKIDW